MGRFALVNLIMSAAFLAWSLIAYRFLPDHPIADASEDALAAREETFNALPAWKEYCTIAAFAVSVIGMMLMNILKYRLRYSGSCGCVCSDDRCTGLQRSSRSYGGSGHFNDGGGDRCS